VLCIRPVDRRCFGAQVSDVVIVHFDATGELSYLVHGDNVQLLIVDDRAQGDRVYEWLPRNTANEIAQMVPAGETIGNSADERHKVLSHKIKAALDGKSHLEIAT
jgi:hypothetical protein